MMMHANCKALEFKTVFKQADGNASQSAAWFRVHKRASEREAGKSSHVGRSRAMVEADASRGIHAIIMSVVASYDNKNDWHDT